MQEGSAAAPYPNCVRVGDGRRRKSQSDLMEPPPTFTAIDKKGNPCYNFRQIQTKRKGDISSERYIKN